jgi:hypothetical protein
VHHSEGHSEPNNVIDWQACLYKSIVPGSNILTIGSFCGTRIGLEIRNSLTLKLLCLPACSYSGIIVFGAEGFGLISWNTVTSCVCA